MLPLLAQYILLPAKTIICLYLKNNIIVVRVDPCGVVRGVSTRSRLYCALHHDTKHKSPHTSERSTHTRHIWHNSIPASWLPARLFRERIRPGPRKLFDSEKNKKTSDADITCQVAAISGHFHEPTCEARLYHISASAAFQACGAVWLAYGWRRCRGRRLNHEEDNKKWSHCAQPYYIYILTKYLTCYFTNKRNKKNKTNRKKCVVGQKGLKLEVKATHYYGNVVNNPTPLLV